MPSTFPDERALRERIVRLIGVYDRTLRSLRTVIARQSSAADEIPSAAELSPALNELNAAESMLKQIVAAWTGSALAIKRALAADIEQLKQSAASCVELVTAAEREYSVRRDGVSRQIDESATRTRAVRAYSHAMRR